LKIFEEPPSDTVIVITSESKSKLLPTIISRAQSIEILPVSKKEAVIYFQKKDHNEIAINSAYLLSGGLTGLMNALLEEDNSHPLKSSINEAKEILKSSKKDRLLKINDFSKDKQKIFNLIFSLERIADSGLTAAKNSGNSDVKRWLDILIASEIAEDALSKNANQKLLLTSLFMSI
jgi:DNA polymerase-3 subunit delta'